MGSNPSGSRPNSFGRQHLTFDKGGKGGGARRGIIVLLQWLWGMAVLGATGGASKASDRCSFAKISGNNKDWCNGRGKPV